MRRYRSSLALGLSLLLHGLLLLVAVRVSRQAPREQLQRPISVDLRYLPAPATRKAAPAAPPVAASPGKSSQPTAHRASGPAAPAQTVDSSPPQRPADAPTGSDARAFLIPRLPSSLGSGEPEPSHGHTLRNEPGAVPDPQAQAAYDAERAARKIQGWALEELADARAQRGLVSPYFNDLKNALEEELRAAPPAVDRKAMENARHAGSMALDTLSDQWQRYAKTGNPLPELDKDTAEVVTRNSGNAQAMLRDPGGNTAAGAIGAAIEGMAPARQLGDRVSEELMLSAIVELLQARDGKVREAHLKKTSGSKAFDEGVLAAAPKAVAKLGPPQGPGLGTNADQIRSVWEFQGRRKYRKKAKAMAKDSDGAGAALNTVASVLTGQAAFDETTGDVSVLDLAHPTLELTAKLLTLY